MHFPNSVEVWHVVFSFQLFQPKICNFAYFSLLCDIAQSSQPLLNHFNNISSRVELGRVADRGGSSIQFTAFETGGPKFPP